MVHIKVMGNFKVVQSFDSIQSLPELKHTVLVMVLESKFWYEEGVLWSIFLWKLDCHVCSSLVKSIFFYQNVVYLLY